MANLPLLKGTLDVLVLKSLSWAPLHGYEITRWLETQSGGRLGLDDSALYQALFRMEERGLIEARWGVTEKNRRARYYSPTPAGRVHLEEETRRLTEYATLLGNILSAEAKG